MAELLLELLSEEMPVAVQRPAAYSLWDGLKEKLRGLRVFDPGIRVFWTPRRLTLVADRLPNLISGGSEEIKGPREGAPEIAIQRFRQRLAGLNRTVAEEWRDEGKGRTLYGRVSFPSRATLDVIAEVLPPLLLSIPWPKSMRWGSGEFRWIRPLQSILCIFDGHKVPLNVDSIPVTTRTRGHRFLCPGEFEVGSFADYQSRLHEAFVLIDPMQRDQKIRQISSDLAAEDDCIIDVDSPITEIVDLVEWPVVLKGSIDSQLMSVPQEVILHTMFKNQKYIAVHRKGGAISPNFLVVANTEAGDKGRTIVTGNERVLRARLWDAKFFWDQDCKSSLDSRLPKLDDMVFHAALGTQGQRVERMVALAGVLASYVPGVDRLLAERAALLSKADLVTGMVGEFPELQGTMGGHYAAAQGEPAPVALAVREHYAPKGPDDDCPTAPESVAVALADKLDTLVGFFAAGIRPTGSKDPFALRRAGLGAIRLVFENRLRLPLRPTAAAALAGYGDRFESVDAGELARDVIGFLADRLKVHLRERGVRHDLIAAAFAAGDEDDIVRLVARAEALQAFMASEDGRNLLSAFRRAGNIVAIEEKRDGRRYDGAPVAGALVEPAEEALHAALEGAGLRISAALAGEDYGGAMADLAALRKPVDRFFDAVMVNAPEPDLRLNRLLLLSRIRSALQQVADFSLIEDFPRGAAAA